MLSLGLTQRLGFRMAVGVLEGALPQLLRAGLAWQVGLFAWKRSED